MMTPNLPEELLVALEQGLYDACQDLRTVRENMKACEDQMQKIKEENEALKHRPRQLPPGQWKLSGGKGEFRWYYEEDPPPWRK
jgi:hypothetical protein